METFVVHSRLWVDRRFLALSAEGRLAYLEFPRLCDGNLGHCCYPNLSALVMALRPDLAVAVLDGDADARERLAHLRDQFAYMIESELLLSDETRFGLAVGFHDWEDGTGASRTKRGRPTAAMGPRLAEHRDWRKVHPNSRGGVREWAKPLGIVRICCPWLSDEEVSEEVGPGMHEHSGNLDHVYRDNGGPSREWGTGSGVQGAGSAMVHGPADRLPTAAAHHDDQQLPAAAQLVLDDCALILAEALELADTAAIQDAGDATVYVIAVCLEARERASSGTGAYQGRPGKLARKKLRDGDRAERPMLAKARRLLKPASSRASPPPEEVAVMRCECGASFTAMVRAGDASARAPCPACGAQASRRTAEPATAGA